MKATIDGEGCISCELCASTCPELLKVLTSILPAGGSISINGIDSGADEYKSMIVYLPQEFDIYPDMKVADILRAIRQADDCRPICFSESRRAAPH